VIGEPDVAAIQETQESIPFRAGRAVGELPHLELALARHLEEVGPLLRDELDADAHRSHVALPQLVILALECRREVPLPEHERLAVGKIAPAVLVAIDVAELVEQRLRGDGIVLRVADERRIVAGHTGGTSWDAHSACPWRMTFASSSTL
jgi:hypothetical protein